MDGSEQRRFERTPEEIAWDEEFREVKRSSLTNDVAGLMKFAARVPGALIQLPMSLVPDETARHARAAAREGFLALRSLLGAAADRIEEMLQEPGAAPATAEDGTVKGPPGTWGTGRTSSGKVKRIEVEVEDD